MFAPRAIPGVGADVDARCHTDPEPAFGALDLIAVRASIIDAGGAIGTVLLRTLLAAGPSALMAGVLDAIDPAHVRADEEDLADPELVSPEIMTRVARECADSGRLVLLQLCKRQESWTAALATRVTHAYASAAMDQTGREVSKFDVARAGVVAEVGLVSGVCGATADVKVTRAELLNRDGVLWATHEALSRGLITESVARLMADAMDGLEWEQMARVEAMVLPRLVRHIDPITGAGSPAGYTYTKDQLARALRRIAPERSRDKHARARSQRGVKIRILEDDGFAQISAWLPKVDGIGFYEHIQTLAEQARAAELAAVEEAGLDPAGVRTLNQCRADVLVEAVVTSAAHGSTAVTVPADGERTAHRDVGILIDLPTLLALRDNAAELPGYGPLDSDLARALAADNEWRRFVHEPLNGQILDLGHTRYQPSRLLREFIHARDPVCTYPGCTQRSRRSQLDHIQPWPQGPTDRSNLHPLCVHHHNHKTHGHWRVERDPDTGATTWTSPVGLIARAPHVYEPLPEDDCDEALPF